jgi:hypothetical protein
MLTGMRSLWVFAAFSALALEGAPPAPTFYKDVLPILEKNCHAIAQL